VDDHYYHHHRVEEDTVEGIVDSDPVEDGDYLEEEDDAKFFLDNKTFVSLVEKLVVVVARCAHLVDQRNTVNLKVFSITVSVVVNFFSDLSRDQQLQQLPIH
jgi:hypothetical protein